MANTPYIDLVKPAGTDKALISVLNANSDKIDSAVGGVQDALAIVCNGNTHGAITSGQYVYVRAHDTLQEGLYTANSNIAANATLSSSNLTANSSGGLNTLSEQIGTLTTPVRITSANLNSSIITAGELYVYRIGKLIHVNGYGNGSNTFPSYTPIIQNLPKPLTSSSRFPVIDDDGKAVLLYFQSTNSNAVVNTASLHNVNFSFSYITSE